MLWGGGAQAEIPVQEQQTQAPPAFVPGVEGQKASATKAREEGGKEEISQELCLQGTFPAQFSFGFGSMSQS